MSDKYPGGFVTAGAPAGFSVAFDGSGDYLSLTPTTALQLANNNFTIELWANFNSASGTQVLNNYGYEPGGTYSYVFYYTSGTIHFANSTDGGSGGSVDSNLGSFTPVVGTWYHIALVRNSTTVTCYVNGVALSSPYTIGTRTIYYPATSGAFRIGVNSTDYFNGYMSNFRLVKGTAVYTTTFTPPTQLFPITNTSLLTCQSPTIIDNSTNNFTITANGDAKVSNFTPFAGYTGFNPALGAAAGGVWTLDQAAYYQNNRQWPIYDPYFNYTTLMLHGNGTNGAQNNTFLDSSTNNFTITRNGNTTQGSFSPFSQTGWSAYVGTSSQYLTVTSQPLINVNDWTVEFWMYPISYVTGQGVFGCSNGGGGQPKISWQVNGSTIELVVYSGGFNTVLNNPYPAVNQWTYVSLSRSSATGLVYLYYNGVLLKTATCPASTGITNPFQLFTNGEGGTSGMYGYLSNFRVSNTALYAGANYSVPTAPLTATTGTKLLTCQSNRFVDNSANNYALAVTGLPSAQAFSPYVPAYITPTTYSNWFDGTADYVTSPTNAAFGFGTSDFTVEFWLCLNSTGLQTIYSNLTSASSTNPHIYITTTIRYFTNGVDQITGAALNAGQWYHIALSRASGSTRLFVNGVQSGSTYTDSNNYGSTAPLGLGTYWSGGSPVTSSNLSGLLSNVRVVKGTALYTAAFTPPTAPLTAITNTTLLTCQSSTFVDNSTSALTLTAAGNAVPVASPTPFNPNVDQTTLNSAYSTSLIGGSAYFDGTGDYLTAPNNAALTPGSGDFTWEAWIYHTVAAGGTNNYTDQTGGGLAIYREPGGQVLVDADGVVRVVTSATTIPVNQWVHLAVTRSGTTARIFFNGALNASNTNSTNIAGTSAIGIGGNPSGANLFTGGYMCGIRFVKGTALYTQNFAPPLTPPTAVTNTQLLLNYTNGAIFDDTAKNVLETLGNAQISTTQSKYGGSSMYFDGTGDRVHISPNTSQSVVLGTGDFTIELWVYFNSLPSGDLLLVGGDTNAAYLIATSAGAIRFGTYNVNWIIGPGGTMTTGTWYHVAVTRSGTTVNLFLNGAPVVSSVSSSQNFSAASYVIGGDQVGGTTSLNGYIDDLRITKACRYFTTFTPPTSALQNQ